MNLCDHVKDNFEKKGDGPSFDKERMGPTHHILRTLLVVVGSEYGKMKLSG